MEMELFAADGGPTPALGGLLIALVGSLVSVGVVTSGEGERVPIRGEQIRRARELPVGSLPMRPENPDFAPREAGRPELQARGVRGEASLGSRVDPYTLPDPAASGVASRLSSRPTTTDSSPPPR